MYGHPSWRDRATADYYTAAVCRRGHAASHRIELNKEPPPEHCYKCGAAVLTVCGACQTPLRGGRTGVATLNFEPDSFCSCGQPQPWATDEAIVFHIENQLEKANLPEADRRELEKQLAVLLNAEAAAKRKADALGLLRRMAPAVWDSAQPAIKMLMTTEIAQHLH
jgi:hypothetical protein